MNLNSALEDICTPLYSSWHRKSTCRARAELLQDHKRLQQNLARPRIIKTARIKLPFLISLPRQIQSSPATARIRQTNVSWICCQIKAFLSWASTSARDERSGKSQYQKRDERIIRPPPLASAKALTNMTMLRTSTP